MKSLVLLSFSWMRKKKLKHISFAEPTNPFCSHFMNEAQCLFQRRAFIFQQDNSDLSLGAGLACPQSKSFTIWKTTGASWLVRQRMLSQKVQQPVSWVPRYLWTVFKRRGDARQWWTSACHSFLHTCFCHQTKELPNFFCGHKMIHFLSLSMLCFMCSIIMSLWLTNSVFIGTLHSVPFGIGLSWMNEKNECVQSCILLNNTPPPFFFFFFYFHVLMWYLFLFLLHFCGLAATNCWRINMLYTHILRLCTRCG